MIINCISTRRDFHNIRCYTSVHSLTKYAHSEIEILKDRYFMIDIACMLSAEIVMHFNIRSWLD